MKCFITILFLFVLFPVFSQTFYKDAAPVFYAKCASCHNSNGIANSDFTNYNGTAPYANTIANYINNGIMPPWPPDTNYSRFVHERTITLSEKNTILQWIIDGAQAGNLSLVPPAPTFSKYKLNGTPDLIIKVPNHVVTANASDQYVCFALPTQLAQDVYLRAYEIVPSDPSLIHHAVLSVDSLGTAVSDLSGNCHNQPGQFYIGDYAPGASPQIFPGVAPLKLGIRIKAGSKLVAQMHYPAGSNGKIDSTEIRMYFYPQGTTGIRKLYNTVPLTNAAFSIAANTIDTVFAQYSVPSLISVSLLSTFPHSHQICTKIENYSIDPSNNKINLIKINNWNFHWQGFYTFKKMLKIQGGSTLYAAHEYDNTVNNPNNPANPNPVTVNVGYNTYDEMLFDGFMWTLYNPGDENIDIEALLANDPLLSINNTQSNNDNLLLLNVFPTPASENVNINFTLNQSATVSLSIYNLLGEKIKEISSGKESSGYVQKMWDATDQYGNKVNSGIYMYHLQLENKSYSGKIVLIK